MSNSLEHSSRVIFNIAPGTSFHMRWIFGQNHSVHHGVLNCSLHPKSRMVPDQVQVRCYHETVEKCSIDFRFQKGFCYGVYMGKNCNKKIHKESLAVSTMKFLICKLYQGIFWIKFWDSLSLKYFEPMSFNTVVKNATDTHFIQTEAIWMPNEMTAWDHSQNLKLKWKSNFLPSLSTENVVPLFEVDRCLC